MNKVEPFPTVESLSRYSLRSRAAALAPHGTTASDGIARRPWIIRPMRVFPKSGRLNVAAEKGGNQKDYNPWIILGYGGVFWRLGSPSNRVFD